MHKRTLCIYEYMTLELAKFLNRTEKAPIAVEKKKEIKHTHSHTHPFRSDFQSKCIHIYFHQ